MDNDVESVNLGRRLALLSDGQVVNICNMLDQEGEDTGYPGAARAFVAGPCKSGKWYAGSVSDYEQIKIS